ncbi:MAG: dihydrofolate reductase family protein [Roseibium sp.]
MREIAVLSFVTLDGVSQGPVQPDEDTSGGFEHCGWVADYLEGAMELVNANFMEAPVAFLFGRKTYEMFSAHWPTTSKTAHGELLNTSPKYVASSSLTEAKWQNSEIINGDIIEALKRIKSEDGPRLQVHGSTDLIQTLIAHDLVDEFRLLTFPVVLGTGHRLFGTMAFPLNLKLEKSQTSDNGVVLSHYKRQRA